jgi:hypothetical protein
MYKYGFGVPKSGAGTVRATFPRSGFCARTWNVLKYNTNNIAYNYSTTSNLTLFEEKEIPQGVREYPVRTPLRDPWHFQAYLAY